MSARTAFVAERLGSLADPEKAAGMTAYMYGRRYQAMHPDGSGRIPYLGVPKSVSAPVFREMLREFPIDSVQEYREAVIELWTLPYREERYLSVGLAAAYPEYLRWENLGLFRRLIVEGAWWDFVDDVAARSVGTVLRVDRDAMSAELDRWANDDHLWVRRSALIAHLKHKDQTDVDQLFRHCLQLAPEREFFIRKAIGWALREYARTDPEAVTAFVLEHRDELSGLSFREASKHLDVD